MIILIKIKLLNNFLTIIIRSIEKVLLINFFKLLNRKTKVYPFRLKIDILNILRYNLKKMMAFIVSIDIIMERKYNRMR
jgi:hypothetical protein